MNNRVSMFHKALAEARAAGDGERIRSLESSLADELGRYGYTLDDYYGDGPEIRDLRASDEA